MINVRLSWFLALTCVGFIATVYQIQIFKLNDKVSKLGKFLMLSILECFATECGVNITYIVLLIEVTTSLKISELRKLNARQEHSVDEVVIVYNRVPKTASTSFVGVAYDLCKKNNFHVLHINVTANNHVLSLNNQYELVNNVTNWHALKPALYHGHFAFVDFSK